MTELKPLNFIQTNNSYICPQSTIGQILYDIDEFGKYNDPSSSELKKELFKILNNLFDYIKGKKNFDYNKNDLYEYFNKYFKEDINEFYIENKYANIYDIINMIFYISITKGYNTIKGYKKDYIDGITKFIGNDITLENSTIADLSNNILLINIIIRINTKEDLINIINKSLITINNKNDYKNAKYIILNLYQSYINCDILDIIPALSNNNINFKGCIAASEINGSHYIYFRKINNRIYAYNDLRPNIEEVSKGLYEVSIKTLLFIRK